jgi:uncharacterized protein (TIGR03437 family)
MKQFLTFAALIALTSSRLLSQAQITGVVNAASFAPGLPFGGALATVFLSGLAGVQPGTYVAPSPSPLPGQLAGFQVDVNGSYAPILAVVVTSSGGVTYGQINFQVPLERNVSLTGSKAGGYDGYLLVCAPPPSGCMQMAPLPPFFGGAFFADANGYAIAQHASDYSRVTLQNPAHPGETIIAYANNFYTVWPPPPIGIPAPAQPVIQYIPGSILGLEAPPGNLYLQPLPTYVCNPIDMGQCGYPPSTPPLQTTFLGLAPSLIGVEQINFVVPAGQQPGTYPLFFDTGGQTGALI